MTKGNEINHYLELMMQSRVIHVWASTLYPAISDDDRSRLYQVQDCFIGHIQSLTNSLHQTSLDELIDKKIFYHTDSRNVADSEIPSLISNYKVVYLSQKENPVGRYSSLDINIIPKGHTIFGLTCSDALASFYSIEIRPTGITLKSPTFSRSFIYQKGSLIFLTSDDFFIKG